MEITLEEHGELGGGIDVFDHGMKFYPGNR